MINSKDFIAAWDHRVGEQTAHIKYNDTFFVKKEVEEFYKAIVGNLNIDDKNILDYGFGGGLFYEWMVNNYHVKRYYGIDIAPRQLNAMNKMIEKYKDVFANVKIGLIDPNKIPDLSEIKEIDILLAIEVLQHSPDKEYYEYILGKFNESKIKIIALTYKRMDTLTFRDKAYKTTHDIGNACFTNIENISGYLSNYRLIENLSTDRIAIFKLKKRKGN